MRKIIAFPALLLILAMFAVAEYTRQREIIFPEIAALALGAWVMKMSPWKSSIFDFWLSPTLAALTGTLIVRFFPYAPFFMLTGAFCLVILQLKLFRSNVLPSISAAVLAVITRSESWCYPLSVCVLTGIIALGRYVLDRSDSRKYNGGLLMEPIPNTAEGNGALSGWLQLSKLLAGVAFVSAIAVGSDNLFMVAPPLLVAFVELSKPGGTLLDRAGKILGLLVFAALNGVLWLALINTVLHWPLWIFAGLSTATVFLAFHALQLPFPPAVAIALLPAILPQGSLWSYPLQVLLGSAAFIVIGKVSFAHAEQASEIENSSSD